MWSQARDPIPQFKKYCLDEGILTQDAIKAIEDDVNQEVEESVQYAEESPKPVCAGCFETCILATGLHDAQCAWGAGCKHCSSAFVHALDCWCMAAQAGC